MSTQALTYEQQVVGAPRPAGLAYVLFFCLGVLAINTFYLVFEQEERRFFLWAALGLGFAASFFLPRRFRITAHRLIDLGSVVTLVWFVIAMLEPDNLSRFGNYLGQMVCMFLVLFSFRSFRHNDFAWLMVIALVIMLLCSIPIYAASYIYSILGFLVLLSTGLVVLNLYPGDIDHRPVEEPLTTSEWTHQFGRMLGLSLVILVITGGIFAGLPQPGLGRDSEQRRVRRLFGVGQLSAETRGSFDADELPEEAGASGGSAYSGFSETFDISKGRSGAIQEDITPILEVRAPGQPYMRAIAWDTYTGREWTRSAATESREQLRTSVDGNNGGAGIFWPAAIGSEAIRAAQAARELDEAQIRLVGTTSTGKGFLFVPWETVQVTGNFQDLYRDDMGTLQIETIVPATTADNDRYTLGKGDQWTALFRTTDPAGVPSPEIALDATAEARFTQLPGSISEQVRATGQELVSGSSDPWNAAVRVAAWLRGRKSYTLNPPVMHASTPEAVHHWLFDSEEGGHCEYFATAAAVLLRAGGVPCRVITGFAPGTFNLEKGAWVIRGKDAHAWVEVFQPGLGWIRFDPTPASWSEDVVDAMSAVTSRLSRALEQYFIYDPRGYWVHDFPRQMTAIRNKLGRLGIRTLAWAQQPAIGDIPRGVLAGVPLIAGALLLGLALRFQKYRIRWGDFPGLRTAETRDWSWQRYLQLWRRLKKIDGDLPEGLTIPELAERVATDQPELAGSLGELAQPFYHFHYDAPEVQGEWREPVEQAWKRVPRVKGAPASASKTRPPR